MALEAVLGFLARAIDHREGVLAVHVGEDQRELVAADARHHVGGPERVAELLGHRTQRLVAEPVAVGVVHLLEAVEVEQHERHLALRALRALDLHLERAVEEAAVAHAGERVRGRLLRELGEGRRQLAAGARHVGELSRASERSVGGLLGTAAAAQTLERSAEGPKGEKDLPAHEVRPEHAEEHEARDAAEQRGECSAHGGGGHGGAGKRHGDGAAAVRQREAVLDRVRHALRP